MKSFVYLCSQEARPMKLARHFRRENDAPVAELVDAPDLGSGVSRRAGSSPVRRTFHRINIYMEQKIEVFIKKNIKFLA